MRDQSGHDAPHVLIVEDERRLRDMLGEALRELGMRNTAAATAEEGLRLLKETPFDVLLMDLNLPAMDGMTMLERLRKDHDDLPVVILTAFGTLDAARKAIRLNVVDFLTKPCMLGDLEQAMARAQRWRRQRNGTDQMMKPDPATIARNMQPEEEDDARDEANDRLILETPTTLAAAEEQIIREALERHHGNRSAAAAELGISRRTLYNRLKESSERGND